MDIMVSLCTKFWPFCVQVLVLAMMVLLDTLSIKLKNEGVFLGPYFARHNTVV